MGIEESLNCTVLVQGDKIVDNDDYTKMGQVLHAANALGYNKIAVDARDDSQKELTVILEMKDGKINSNFYSVRFDLSVLQQLLDEKRKTKDPGVSYIKGEKALLTSSKYFDNSMLVKLVAATKA